MTFIGATTWNDVFADWREREAAWGWESVWRPRGFASWDAWRKTYTEPLGLERRRWEIAKLDDPAVVVPGMWAIAYGGWRRYYPSGASRARLADIAAHPDLPQNEKIVGLLKSFPNPTTLIVIRSGDDLALFEGMHRGAAIALEARVGRRVASDVFIAQTMLDGSERHLFEHVITQKR